MGYTKISFKEKRIVADHDYIETNKEYPVRFTDSNEVYPTVHGLRKVSLDCEAPNLTPVASETNNKYTIRDSGIREVYKSGMQRDTAKDKIDYSLILDGPLYRRWVIHLTNGAKKYSKRNWMKAAGEAELERFRESAIRHFNQWLEGDTTEDHVSATVFNLNGYCYVQDKLNEKV